MLCLTLIAVLGVFGLCSAEGEHVKCAFFSRFGEEELRESSETHVCSSKDGIQKVSVHLTHSAKRKNGRVTICGLRERVELEIQYAAVIWEDASTSIRYISYDSAIRAKAKVEDFCPFGSEEKVHVAFMPPNSATVDWFPYVEGMLRPRPYWMFACDGEFLTFTRLIFHSGEEGRVHFFSIDMMLNKLAQGTVSWGDMSLDDKNDRNVVGCRFLWVPSVRLEQSL